MTENEAKNILIEHLPIIEFSKYSEALNIALHVLEDIQEYREIGTVEEFRDLKEKSAARKPIQDEHFQHDYICPFCGRKLAESVDDNVCLEEEMAGWCACCGQKLDWS